LTCFGVTPPILNDLRNKSLLRNAGSRRYDMHALVQQFSSEALEADAQSAAQAREHHSRYFLGLFADQAVALDSRNARMVCDLIQPDWENIVSAWHQAVAPRERRGSAECVGEPDLLLRIARSCGRGTDAADQRCGVF
jgi:hypothetical protein